MYVMENGKLEKYKLASEGINQAQLAGELFLKELKENDIPLENVYEDLRERYFGPTFELQSHDKEKHNELEKIKTKHTSTLLIILQ
ncbi:hypothetical protein HanIR_Chr10g0498521 [Helianthus annuus]|nr:hypothetical protein HanIR_Chr10g0498521 [Helianthus annuus]